MSWQVYCWVQFYVLLIHKRWNGILRVQEIRLFQGILQTLR